MISRRLQEPESEGSTAKETGRKSGAGGMTHFNWGMTDILTGVMNTTVYQFKNQFSSMFKINFIV